LNQQQQQQQQQPMQLIDSINETGLPNEIFSDSIINHQQFLINNNDSFQTNNKLKNWNSESNLTKTKQLDKLNKSCMNNNNNNNNELIDQSYYDYDEDGDVLQFSDHAGLFATPDTNNDQEEEEDEENEEDELNNEHQTNLLTNYDVYQATKTNYKLTYHDNNTELFSLKNKNNKFQQNDSLVNSTDDQLIMQQIQSNYEEEEEEEDQENKYYYLLKKLEKQQNHLNESSMLDESQQLNDSIMNWSMKISNYNYNNHYQQQKQQLEYQLLNNNKSQSPLSALLAEKQYLDIITAQANQQNLIPRSNSSFTKLFLTNRQQQQQQQQQLSNKSTTSWGKLKHSKSSSSNIANNNNNNAVTTSYCSHIDSDDVVSQSILNQDELNINFLQSVHINDKQQQQVANNIPSISSSPSLFKLFQNNSNKTNDPLVSLLNTSSETTNSSTNNNNNKRTTSFSQLRQRSLSSCTIGQTPSPTQILSPQQQQQQEENIETVINNKTNLVVVVDTSSSNNKKKQTQQYINQIDQSMQTSTIVCMLVDRNNSKTSKELMEVAARAARAAVAARKSINLYQTKSSLPDLTFLKDYGDDNLSTRNNTTPSNDSTNNNNNNNNQLKSLKKQ